MKNIVRKNDIPTMLKSSDPSEVLLAEWAQLKLRYKETKEMPINGLTDKQTFGLIHAQVDLCKGFIAIEFLLGLRGINTDNFEIIDDATPNTDETVPDSKN